MYVLIPDDPVFFAKFQSLEEPLLRHLYRLHSEGRESDDERIISDAYDSWVQVLLKLPLWSEWHSAGRSTDPASDERAGYVLYSPRGDQLTSLYPIEVTAVDLGHLTACLDLFVGHHQARRAMPGQEPAEQQESDGALTDVFRRVMEVLVLPPPPRLLTLLRRIVPPAAVVSVTLPAKQETEYRHFCEDIVTILSSGDTFAYRSHRAMYL
ncbi:hypothetical protein [Streptomyces sp. Ncost-T10-10d]|uniref:hypothetical protein n=1 Tax=Streptomyces sp. Ncost-T10-10d TaxID=1839774 RepID=UPI00081DB40B|nr:hypothetical protein [Streptomyces sp. Ncost-T10-10d]SCF64960.1 hypothetical protein GA0115254_109320 [Streptomyces sp. Ncost-T10-10d]